MVARLDLTADLRTRTVTLRGTALATLARDRGLACVRLTVERRGDACRGAGRGSSGGRARRRASRRAPGSACTRRAARCGCADASALAPARPGCRRPVAAGRDVPVTEVDNRPVARRVSSPVFVGRAEELRTLDGALAAAPGGTAPRRSSPASRRRQDPPADRVLRARVRRGRPRAHGRLHRARRGRAAARAGGRAPRGLGYALDGDALDAVLVRATGPRAPAPGAAGRRDAAPVADQGRLFELLLGTLARLRARAVVVAVEDPHWADHSTRDLLAFLARNLRDERAAARGHLPQRRAAPAAPPAAASPSSSAGRIERIELDRFGAARSSRAAHRRSSARRPTRTSPGGILDRSDGNPFFAEELLAAARAGAGAPDPARHRCCRVARLSDAGAAMLRVAAAPAAAPATRCAVASGLPESELEARCARRRPALLVRGRRRLRVPARARARGGLRRSAAGRAPADARALRQCLDARPGSADRARRAAEDAHHWDAPAHRHAGARCLRRRRPRGRRIFAYAEARRQYEHALELWDDAESVAGIDRVAVLGRAAEAAASLGDPARAVTLAEQGLAELDEEADPVRAGLLSARLGRYLWVAGARRRGGSRTTARPSTLLARRAAERRAGAGGRRGGPAA